MHIYSMCHSSDDNWQRLGRAEMLFLAVLHQTNSIALLQLAIQLLMVYACLKLSQWMIVFLSKASGNFRCHSFQSSGTTSSMKLSHHTRCHLCFALSTAIWLLSFPTARTMLYRTPIISGTFCFRPFTWLHFRKYHFGNRLQNRHFPNHLQHFRVNATRKYTFQINRLHVTGPLNTLLCSSSILNSQPWEGICEDGYIRLRCWSSLTLQQHKDDSEEQPIAYYNWKHLTRRNDIPELRRNVWSRN